MTCFILPLSYEAYITLGALFLKIITLLFLVLYLIIPRATFAQEKNITQYKLPNGMQVIVKVDTRASVVLSEMWYRVGSSYERTGMTGLSHMLEHLMYKGTPLYPGESFFKIVAENGGMQNAMTSEDFTVYYQELANDKLPLALKLEADRMQNLNFNEQDFEKELKVVQEERRMRIDNDPIMLTYEQFVAAAYLNNPYRNPIAGWGSDLAQLTLADAKKWYKSWYVPNNAILVVVGNVSPFAVYQLALENFGKIPAKSLPEVKAFPHVTISNTRLVTVSAPAKLPILYMGYPVESAISNPVSDEPYALDVLNTILGGNNSSRLEKNIVRNKQLASDITVSYRLYARLPVLFEIAAIPAAHVKPAVLEKAILKEIQTLKSKPISQEELNRVKIQVIANRVYEQDSIESQGMLLGSLASVGRQFNEINHYEQEIEKLTPQRIQSVAKKYLQEKDLTTGILIPQDLRKSHD